MPTRYMRSKKHAVDANIKTSIDSPRGPRHIAAADDMKGGIAPRRRLCPAVHQRLSGTPVSVTLGVTSVFEPTLLGAGSFYIK